MPDFLTPIAAVVALIASAMAERALNRQTKMEETMQALLESNRELKESNRELKAELTEVKRLLRREKRKRGPISED